MRTDASRRPKEALGILIEEANRHPLLSREREAELSCTIRANSDPIAVKAAIDELVNSNVRLVIYFATKKMRPNPKFSPEDRVAAGLPGLFLAARNFDATKASFAQHAMFWIKQKIREWEAENNPDSAFHVPKYVLTAYLRRKRTGRPDTEDTTKWGKGARYAHFAEKTTQPFDPLFHIKSADSKEPDFDEPTDSEKLSRLLKAAHPRERRAIELYYGVGSQSASECQTFRAVGGKLGVTKQRACEIIASGLDRIRSRAGAAI